MLHSDSVFLQFCLIDGLCHLEGYAHSLTCAFSISTTSDISSNDRELIMVLAFISAAVVIAGL